MMLARVMLAIVALLSAVGVHQVAYAQLPGTFDVQLGEDMSIGDAIDIAALLTLERSISETLSISDLLGDSPDAYSRSIDDAITVQEGESVSKQAASSGSGSGNNGKVARSMSDELSFEEQMRVRERSPRTDVPELAERRLAESIGVLDATFLSGSVVPPAPPQLSVSGGGQAFNMDSAEAAVITFLSSSSGTYRIAIDNADGEAVTTISGQMVAGENNARWDGTDSEGEFVTDGTYTYYITANNDVGTRTPPSEGDGTIIVSGAPVAQAAPADWMPYAVAVPVVAAVGAGAYLFSRRRNRLVVYLPPGASPVIDEIRTRYPRTIVQDYITPQEDGAKMVKGVAIPGPKESDEEWFDEIITRAKELAGVDSINVSHRGKVHAV